MKKKKLNEITRIDPKTVAEPEEYWALFSKSYYEDIFSKITDRYELLDTYKDLLKKVNPGIARAALTFFYRLRRDEIDKKFNWALVEHLEKRVEEFVKLFESPDVIKDGRDVLSFSDDHEAIAFGYRNDELLVPKKLGETHGDIFYKGRRLEREDLKYSGRLWKNSKIISFWEYPPVNEMKKVLGDIEKVVKQNFNISLGLLTDPEWRIEIITGKYKTDRGQPDYKFDWQYAKDTELIPLKNYIGSKDWSPEEKAKAHVMSPMEKMKKLQSKPSDYFKSQKRKPLPWRQAMYAESYKNIEFPKLKLFEDPDRVEDFDMSQSVNWTDSDAIPFGYFEGKMYVGSFNRTHGGIYEKYKNKKLEYADRADFKYPGRIWVDRKILSFWKFPPVDFMPQLLSDLEEEVKKIHHRDLNLISYSGWRIELKEGNLVPLKDYIGSEKRSAKELAKVHVMSPMEKARKLTSKSSAYFKSQKRKPLPWRQAMYAESRNGNHNLVPTTLNEFLKYKEI